MRYQEPDTYFPSPVISTFLRKGIEYLSLCEHPVKLIDAHSGKLLHQFDECPLAMQLNLVTSVSRKYDRTEMEMVEHHTTELRVPYLAQKATKGLQAKATIIVAPSVLEWFTSNREAWPQHPWITKARAACLSLWKTDNDEYLPSFWYLRIEDF